MNLTLLKVIALALSALLLAACGGSSHNASPGAVVVIQEVEREQPEPNSEPEPVPDPQPPTNGTTTASVIPEALRSVIADSGATASMAFGNKPIYTIDVTALTNGQLDPTGLLLGNDLIFQIEGGALRVTPQEGGDCELNMAPGSILVGGGAQDFLVVERGCRLLADGSDGDGNLDQPIVFTARKEVDGDVEDRERGLWGGLVINGYAPINDCPEAAGGGTDECTKEGEANSGLFGGSKAHDDSGVLRYVSVRFAGAEVDAENQLNGIAFQGVGDGTEAEFVQVHNNLDDGVEFFGGTVNAKYVVLTGNADDSLDWTDGWTGRIQYLYIEQTGSADNAIEADNREGNETATPRSNPTIANMSVFGNANENALRLRRGTGLALRNSFVDGSATCIRVDGTSRDLLGTELTVEGVGFACAETHNRDSDGAVAAYLGGAANVSQNGDAVDPVSLSDTFFDNTDFIGAFGSEDWSAGWTYSGSVSNAMQPDFGCRAASTESSQHAAGGRGCPSSATVVAGDNVAAIQAEPQRGNVSTSAQRPDAADVSGDGFFAVPDFIGAVHSADEEWTHGWAVGMPRSATGLECPDGTTEIAAVGGRRTCELSGMITGDLTLTRSNYYVLDGKVAVGGDNVASAVLTIESGTTIMGDDAEDFLVISRGSRIEANGTRSAPITMTAVADVTGNFANPVRTRGEWGGLVINGNAPINDCPEGAGAGTAQCTRAGEADSGLFGGDDPHDSSGRLHYVVVKFAGSNVDPKNQLNGIAFQGVGAGTDVDYVQVFNSLDDGVEFFGGTVDAKHLVLVGNADDSLDWTDGWVGSIQYLHIVQPEATGSADNMIEADNREGNPQATPISEPHIANMTMIGLSGERAIRLRLGTGLRLYNSEVTGSATCLRIQGESANLLGTRIQFVGVRLDCDTVNEGDDEAAVQSFLDDAANITQQGTMPNPMPLPAATFKDDAGSMVIGSDIANWGSGWTVGLDNQ